MTSISSLQSLTLDLPPSCIAFCPTERPYFVVGTYHLHRAEEGRKDENAGAITDEGEGEVGKAAVQTRTGTLILFRLMGQAISHVCTIETAGAVLDIQWLPQWGESKADSVLAVATSVGRIEFYDLLATPGREGERRTISSSTVYRSLQVAEPDVLVLSLTCHPSRAGVVGFTLSDGRVCMCDIHSCNTESAPQHADSAIHFHIREIFSHSLEAWTLAFTASNTVLSGGDDAILQLSSLDDYSSLLNPRWQDRRTHMAGVTAILPLTPDLVLTGSYDDRIRLLSGVEGGRRRVVETDIDLGGGVWRLRLLDSSPSSAAAAGAGEGGGGEVAETGEGQGEGMKFLILASCMHAGTRVVQLSHHPEDSGTWRFAILAKFEEHQSMNYGSDVQPTDADDAANDDSGANPSTSNYSGRNVVSTSFYDKLLCLWRLDQSQLGGAKENV